MKSVLILFICFLSFLSVAAQVKGFGKSYAFYKEKTQGNIMADDHGAPVLALPLIERYIYLEVKENMNPVIQSVIYKGKYFSPSIFAVDNFRIGRRKKDGKEVKMQPAGGYKLWRIELNAVDTVANNVVELKNKIRNPKGIYLIGTKDKNTFTFKVAKEDELIAEEVY